MNPSPSGNVMPPPDPIQPDRWASFTGSVGSKPTWFTWMLELGVRPASKAKVIGANRGECESMT